MFISTDTDDDVIWYSSSRTSILPNIAYNDTFYKIGSKKTAKLIKDIEE